MQELSGNLLRDSRTRNFVPFTHGNILPATSFDVGLELLLEVSRRAALGYIFGSVGLLDGSAILL